MYDIDGNISSAGRPLEEADWVVCRQESPNLSSVIKELVFCRHFQLAALKV